MRISHRTSSGILESLTVALTHVFGEMPIPRFKCNEKGHERLTKLAEQIESVAVGVKYTTARRLEKPCIIMASSKRAMLRQSR